MSVLGLHGENLPDTFCGLCGFLHAEVLLEGWIANRRAKDNDSFGRRRKLLKLLR